MTNPTVPVPGPDTPTWTIDDDGDPWWTDAHGGIATVQVEAVEHHPAILDAYDALVADVRAARAHEHCGPATDTLQRIKDEFNSYEDIVGDPYDCARFVGFVSDLLTDGGGDG